MVEALYRGVVPRQRLVSALFRSSIDEWTDLYYRPDVYSIIYQRRRATALELLTRVRLPCGSDILEVGCGPGLTTTDLARRGYRIHAIDLVPEMLDCCRRRVEEFNVLQAVRFSAGDAQSLAFRDSAFDAIFVVGVTEWVPFLDAMLNELRRVLKPSGYLVITSDNSRALHSLANPIGSALSGHIRRIGRALLRGSAVRPKVYAYSRDEFESRLSQAGFVTLETKQVGFGPFAFCGLRMPDGVGVHLDRKLQALADRGSRLLQSTGHVHVVLARPL